MKVGILGSGEVGQALGTGFAKHGHEVMMGTRDVKKPEVVEWVKATPGSKSGTYEQTAKFGQIIVLAVPGHLVVKIVEQIGPANFGEKLVLDATNPTNNAPPVNGVLSFFTGPNESVAERIQAKIPAARVVKAFSSVGAAQMVNPHFTQGTPTMFICGNSDAAKNQTVEILKTFGWETLDCGGIDAAQAIEPLSKLWCIPGFLRNQWTHAFKVLTK